MHQRLLRLTQHGRHLREQLLQLPDERRHEAEECELHWRSRVFQRIERRHRDFDHRNCGESRREKKESPCGQLGRRGIESAVLKENLDDFVPQEDQPHRCRKRNKQDHAHREIDSGLHLANLFVGRLAREQRQNGS
jgi:hypothetical protein